MDDRQKIAYHADTIREVTNLLIEAGWPSWAPNRGCQRVLAGRLIELREFLECLAANTREDNVGRAMLPTSGKSKFAKSKDARNDRPDEIGNNSCQFS
jgi:hypothetical protein